MNLEKWIDNLSGQQQLVFPRCLKPETVHRLNSIQLHHFADALEIGYGAVSYLRLVDASGLIHCVLLMGKSGSKDWSFLLLMWLLNYIN